MQKKRGFIQEPHCLRERRTPISETISLPTQACGSFRDRKGRDFFFLLNYLVIFWCPIHLSSQPFGCLDPVYSYFQLLAARALSIHLPSFWHLQAFSIRTSVFWRAQCKNLPLHHLGQWGRLPGAPLLSTIALSVFSHSLSPFMNLAIGPFLSVPWT